MKKEIMDFVESWTADPLETKDAFIQYAEFLETIPGGVEFVARPGISYSVRGKSTHQGRDVLALVDVIDDIPSSRWLSVCFYEETVTDPEGRGDLVPAGLNGQDAICFDLDEKEPEQQAYIMERLKEAAKNDKA